MTSGSANGTSKSRVCPPAAMAGPAGPSTRRPERAHESTKAEKEVRAPESAGVAAWFLSSRVIGRKVAATIAVESAAEA